MNTYEHQTKNKMEFGMRIARHCILKEIDNGCQKNLVISPLSLHIALNMVASASTGRTLKQFLRFLESESITDLNAQSSLFMELVTSGDGGPNIALANGIWVDHRFPMKDSFKQMAKDVYKAQAKSVDFANEEEQAIDKINSWARKASKGHIYPLLPDGFFKENSGDEDPVALLASAIYFNSKWVQKFDSKQTKEEDFHLLSGDTVRVPFMKEYSTRQLYGSFESFKLLKMEYKKGQSDSKTYAMYIFLPNEKDGLQELVQRFESDPRFLMENRKVSKVDLKKLWLPKLKYEYGLNADETMKELGLKLPFHRNKAKITEMVETPPDKKVYLSKAIQKAYIEVDEEGTVATVITCIRGMTGAGRSRRPPRRRPSFVADHPFLFMIKEEVSDIILFIGAALNPISENGAGKKRKMKASNEEGKKKRKDR